jgi:hypothetical protein
MKAILLIASYIGSVLVIFSSSWSLSPSFRNGLIHTTDVLNVFRQPLQQQRSKTFHRFSMIGGILSSTAKLQLSVFNGPSTSSNVAQESILHHFNAIQGESHGRIAIIGTSELDSNQQQMIELLAYALVLSGNHVYTSGGGNGTNLAVIRGAMRAKKPDLLTVLLPQSLYKQPSEMKEILVKVEQLIEQPENDGLGLREAAQLCNYKLVSMIDKVIVFVYHDSSTILSPLEDFEEVVEIVRFFLD